MIPRLARAAALFFGLLTAATASAHFNLNLNVRIFHVEHARTGLRLYVRMPMPYLVADKSGPADATGLPAPAPFTTNRQEPDRLAHLVDWRAVSADPSGLGTIAADGLAVEAGGERLAPRLVGIQVHRIGTEPPFATLAEARAAFEEPSPAVPPTTDTYVGDALVDLVIDYEAGARVDAYTLSSSLDPGLPAEEETANLILDYSAGSTDIFRTRGLMREGVAVHRAEGAGVWTFVHEGIRHILGGMDHVLFVLCLVLGASGLGSLASRITGFTLGHSVTLSLGFFGFVPSGAWFVPAVETGIALSIIYAAAIAIIPSRCRERDGRIFLVTCGIGLLHGLGFSFILHEILKIDAPNIWQSLLAFNFGVEIGQLAVIAIAWPALLVVHRLDLRAWQVSRVGAAGVCIAIAALWTGERLLAVWAQIA